MTKAELIQILSEEAAMPRSRVIKVMEAFLEIIKSEIPKGEKIPVGDLGYFYLGEYKARRIKDRFSGAVIKVPGKKFMKFNANK